MIELSCRILRASYIRLDVITWEVSNRSVYISSQYETFSELEPKLDHGGVSAVPVMMGITVETWLCLEIMVKNKFLKVSTKGLCVKKFHVHN
ncbi:hypothetical protein IGI04_030320 [Brassica rapa subsp. trilocularis]|uniref:Uncharacterized protein n=1 Tax=Brassica rapa subsp. trilocularis TaxID=1813537 RepID=A0ABQ7LQF4_BRACM|nr:hypothetical protein IGI04_030320 [Brassica rapa subsp. trilocularis]